MKYRVIAFFLILLLLTVPFVTGVFAAPGDERETPESQPEQTEAQASAAAESSEPAAEATETSQPAQEPEPDSSAATEPEAPAPEQPEQTQAPTEEPAAPEEPAPEAPRPAEADGVLVIRLEEALEGQDLLFTVRSEKLSVQVVLPAGADSVRLKGLRPGDYTVTLERSWSWRYDKEAGAQELTRSLSLSQGQTVSAVFRPVPGESQWLSGTARGDGT